MDQIILLMPPIICSYGIPSRSSAAEIAHDAFSLLEPTAKIVEDSDEENAKFSSPPFDEEFSCFFLLSG